MFVDPAGQHQEPGGKLRNARQLADLLWDNNDSKLSAQLECWRFTLSLFPQVELWTRDTDLTEIVSVCLQSRQVPLCATRS